MGQQFWGTQSYNAEPETVDELNNAPNPNLARYANHIIDNTMPNLRLWMRQLLVGGESLRTDQQ